LTRRTVKALQQFKIFMKAKKRKKAQESYVPCHSAGIEPLWSQLQKFNIENIGSNSSP
jgi:hypothetical protein